MLLAYGGRQPAAPHAAHDVAELDRLRGLVPRLALSDGAGGDRLWLAVRLGSPVLQFLDPGGVARTGLTTFNDDTGVAVISATDRSKPGLVLLGNDRSVVWSVP